MTGRRFTRTQKDEVLKELESAPHVGLLKVGTGEYMTLSAGTAMDIRAQLLCECGRYKEALEIVTWLEDAVETVLLREGYSNYYASCLLLGCTHSYNLMSKHTTHMPDNALERRIHVAKRVLQLLEGGTSQPQVEMAHEARGDLCFALLHSKLYREILPTLRESMDLMGPEEESGLCQLLSTALICLRRLPEAEEVIRRGLASAERKQHTAHRKILTYSLARVLNTMGRGDEALHVLESLTQPDRQLVWTPEGLCLRADILQKLGRLEEAIEVDEMLVAVAEKCGKDLQLDRCTSLLHRRALLDMQEGRKEDAVAWLRKWRLEINSNRIESFRVHSTRPVETLIGPRELLIDLLKEEGGNDEEIRLLSEEVQAVKDHEDKLRQEALEEVREERRPAPADGGDRGRRRRQKKRGKGAKGARRSARPRAEHKGGASARHAPSGSTTTIAAGGGDRGVVSQDQQQDDHQHQQQQQETEEEKAPMPLHQTAEDQECSICFLELQGNTTEGEEGGGCVLRDCGHCFHYQCLDSWAEKCQTKGIEPTCPLCRAPLRRYDQV